ncbi:MAG TPA: TonB-dependent receptor [Longimicrobiales bacterium]
MIRRMMRVVCAAVIGCALAALNATPLSAQDAGVVRGTVASSAGELLAGVRLYVDGTTRGALSDESGRFLIDDVPAGERVLIAEYIGHRTLRTPLAVRAGATAELALSLDEEVLEIAELVVTATREERALAETPATIGVVDASAIREVRPTHPSEIMGKVPGVWVNVTGGEGHMTAIRQPLTTDPVYLYLEDGIPTRSTGFFNHNALYEINVPQAQRIEVLKGPSSALYGSDAIGGMINVETRPAVAAPGLRATLEAGTHGFTRALASYGLLVGDAGIRTDVNYTTNDGWREGTAYDRVSGTVRWDQAVGAGSVRAVAAFSRIDQQTAGSSRLAETDYEHDPERNLTPISYRDVSAARLSVEYERTSGESLFTVTPFARYNAMEILPNWSLSYDPGIWQTSNASLGVLAKYRRGFEPMDARVIVGVDVDYSPGEHFERAITPVQQDGEYVDYAPGAVLYDYDVAFLGVSPYLQAEASPHERVRVTAGLRFDHIGYDYDNGLTELQSGMHRRPGSTSVEYTQLSPKLGVTLALGAGASAFASYSEGFRAPSEGQLFRQGSAANTVGLEPVEAISREGGLRGVIGERLRWSLSGYSMIKQNDILAYQRPDDVRETVNAGETLHRGVEIGAGAALPLSLVLETALSHAKHTYQEWRPNATTDYSGNEMESAPRTLANTSLSWQPVGGARVGVEWVHQGSYWLDAANTQEYGGHDVLNLSASWPVRGGVTLFGRLNNLTDARYAESAGWSAFRGREFAPGAPRSLFVGAEVEL